MPRLSPCLVAVMVCQVFAFATAFTPCIQTSSRSTTSKRTTNRHHFAAAIDTSFMWNAGLSFGKGDFKFYNGFNAWMKPFSDADRQAYPEVFQLPTGLYEVALSRPLGIVFEEISVGKGLVVKEVVDGGNAAATNMVQVNDVLVGITAVKIVGAKYERRMIPCRNFDFDTMVGAVGSNDAKWQCNNVILLLERPSEADSRQVDAFLEFFEPPFDNPWKQRQ